MAEVKSKIIRSISSGRANQKSKIQIKSKKLETKKPAPKSSKVGSVKLVKAQALKPTTPAPKKVLKKKESTLTISVYGLNGKVSGKVSLPPEIFGDRVNKKLLAQAVRVYLANKRQGNAHTKTRGEVDGSTRKIYRQKGTGKARHGSLRAPIFVKGGIVHGPRNRDFSLELPKKMRRKALFSALSAKLIDGQIRVLSGFESLSPKTKNFVEVLNNLTIDEKKRKLLLVTPDNFDNLKRASRNLTGISSTSAKRLNALVVLSNKQLIFAKEALSEMEKYFLRRD